MSGFWDSYNNLSETLITSSQHLLAPEILIPSVLGVGAVVVASIVVAMDGDRGRHVERALAALTPMFIVLPFLALGIWLANGGDDTIKEPARGMPDGNILVSLVVVLFQIAYILFITVLFFLFPFIMVAGLAVVGYSLVRASPDLIMILFLALAPVGRGLGTVLYQPFRAFRALAYLFTQPGALKELKRVTRAKDAKPEDIRRAHRKLQEEFDRVNDSTKRRFSNFTVQAFTYNYHKFSDTLSARRARLLAAYNRAIARTATETRHHIEESFKHKRDTDEKDH